MAKTIWGYACGTFTATVNAPIGIALATIESVSEEKPFKETLSDCYDNYVELVEEAAEFGDNHSKLLDLTVGPLLTEASVGCKKEDASSN